MVSDICSMCMQESDPARVQDCCRGKKLVQAAIGTLCTCVLQVRIIWISKGGYRLEIHMLELSWVDGLKEIIRNKEMLSINQLLPSLCMVFSHPQFVAESPDTDEKSQKFLEVSVPPFLYSVWGSSLLFSDKFMLPTHGTSWFAALQASLSFSISQVCSNSCPLLMMPCPAISSSILPFLVNPSQHLVFSPIVVFISGP